MLVVHHVDRLAAGVRSLIIVRTKLGPCAPYSHAVRTTSPTRAGGRARPARRPAWCARRRCAARDIVLGIRPASVPGENVVGRDLHQAGPSAAQAAARFGRAAALTGERVFLGRLGVVDRGPGRAVDDHVGQPAGDRIGDGGGVGHVQAGPVHPGHRLTAGGQRGDQVGTEHPASPGDQPPGHDTRPDPAGTGAALACLSGSHQDRGCPHTSARSPPGPGGTGPAARTPSPQALSSRE